MAESQEFPADLSAPFAGCGRWKFILCGGPYDGGTSYQEVEAVLRIGDRMKWRCGNSRAAIYDVRAIDGHAKIVYAQHARMFWAEA
jgi:hypothetical protein